MGLILWAIFKGWLKPGEIQSARLDQDAALVASFTIALIGN
jgi:hypothetical protein